METISFKQQQSLEQFKMELNNLGGACWKIEEPSHKTGFLDLNIQLVKATILTSTYQKGF